MLEELNDEERAIDADLRSLHLEFDNIVRAWREYNLDPTVVLRQWHTGIGIERMLNGFEQIFDPDSIRDYEWHGKNTDVSSLEMAMSVLGSAGAYSQGPRVLAYLWRAYKLKRLADEIEDIVVCEMPTTGGPIPRGSRPGSIKGNPNNRRVETGVPKNNGQGWVKRWTRMTREDEIKQAEAVAKRYDEILDAAKSLPTEQERRQFILEQMKQFRTEYRQDFLNNRNY